MSSLLGAKVLAIGGAVVLAGAGAGFGMRAKSKMHARGDFDEFMQWKIEKTLTEIDATPEQSEKINAILDDLKDQGFALHDAKRETHQAFKAELSKDEPDVEALHELVDARTAEFNEFAHEVVDAVVEIQQTLTPEQRAQVEQMMAEHHARRGQWHGHP